MVDGDIGRVDLRPEGGVLDAFREKVALAEQAREVYRTLRGRPATTRDGVTVRLRMNAGVLADLRITSYNVCYTKLLRLTISGTRAGSSISTDHLATVPKKAR